MIGVGLVIAAPLTAQDRIPDVSPPPWRPVLASVILPGAGQLDLGQARGWGYLAMEAVIWTGYGLTRHAGLEDRGAFRDLAWEEARDRVMPRVDGDFDYYERLARWRRSGSFDLEPEVVGVQPERDPDTFNGDAWALALDIVGLPPDASPNDEGYDVALDFYRDRAYPAELLWDWTGRAAALERYRRLMDESDRHLRQSTIILGGVFLNRLVSASDAYLSRLAGSSARLRVQPVRRGADLLPFLTLQVVLP
ncbi:MAG: hypothetical protein P8188_08885 [Gemmatimonadota bacterium]